MLAKEWEAVRKKAWERERSWTEKNEGRWWKSISLSSAMGGDSYSGNITVRATTAAPLTPNLPIIIW